MMRQILLSPFAAMALGACALVAGEPMSEARAAFESQDIALAERLARNILDGRGDEVEALELLARVHLAKGEGRDAAAILEKLKKKNASPADAVLLEAEALLQMGEPGRARRLLANQDSAECWRLLALAAVADGNTKAAEYLTYLRSVQLR